MLHIDGYGNLGIIHRRKANEGRMIFPRILNSTCLATDRIASLYAGGRSLFYGQTHPINHDRISRSRNLRMALRQITFVLGILMNMRDVIPSTIGNGNSEVAELQRCTGDIALSHTCPPDRLTIPSVLIATIQIVCTSKQSPLFAFDVDVHRSAQPHRLHVRTPSGDGLFLRIVYKLIVDHRTEIQDKPCITGMSQRIF